MRPHVCLLLALAALHARAASIPAPAHEPEAAKEALDTDKELHSVSSEQKLIDQTNVVQDFDNKLLKQTGGEPVSVKITIDEGKLVLKTEVNKEDIDKVDVDDGAGIKRVDVDLKHPGEPQRQEHETQNPEHYENENVVFTTFKKVVDDAQNVFNKGFSEITHGINEILEDHEPKISVKQSIDHLQATFKEQMDKLNATIQCFWNPESVENKEKQVKAQKVESGLKVIEDDFDYGVKSLSTGVEVLTLLKSEIREDASSTTEKPASNPLFPFFQNFQQTIQQGFGNLTSNVQNFFANQNSSSAAAAGAQSDEGANPSPSRPTVWQGIQNTVQGFFNPGQQQQGVQNDESPAPSGPFAQVIQNNPFVQSVINFIQPRPQKTQPAPSKPAASTESEGSNVVPLTGDKPTNEQKIKPAEAAQPAPASEPAKPQAGPIQQIIQRNPIVKGITNAMKRITNPEKPREEPAAEKSQNSEHNIASGGSGAVKNAAELDIEKVSEEKPEEIPAKEESLKVEKIEKIVEPIPAAPVKQD